MPEEIREIVSWIIAAGTGLVGWFLSNWNKSRKTTAEVSDIYSDVQKDAIESIKSVLDEYKQEVSRYKQDIDDLIKRHEEEKQELIKRHEREKKQLLDKFNSEQEKKKKQIAELEQEIETLTKHLK